MARKSRAGNLGASSRRPRLAPQKPQRLSSMRHERRRLRPEAGRSRPQASALRREGVLWIYGIHAVAAALANARRTVLRLSLTENAEMRLRAVLETRQIAAERVLPRDLERRLGSEAVHQGALLECESLPEPSLESLAERASGRPLIVLDQITDPHNVGAILRSAAAFGAAGLIMPRRHSPPLEGALAKAASGALELIAIALVANLARALTELKQQQFVLIGLDANATELVEKLAWPPRSALVLGAEGKGLRQLTRQSCDRLCRIATEGALESLNVSNAAAVALHVAAMRRLALA